MLLDGWRGVLAGAEEIFEAANGCVCEDGCYGRKRDRNVSYYMISGRDIDCTGGVSSPRTGHASRPSDCMLRRHRRGHCLLACERLPGRPAEGEWLGGAVQQ